MAKEKRPLRLTVEEQEQLSLHDLAELLANVILVLRRLPDVPVSDLLMKAEASSVADRVRREPKAVSEKPEGLPDWTK